MSVKTAQVKKFMQPFNAAAQLPAAGKQQKVIPISRPLLSVKKAVCMVSARNPSSSALSHGTAAAQLFIFQAKGSYCAKRPTLYGFIRQRVRFTLHVSIRRQDIGPAHQRLRFALLVDR